MAEIVRGWIIGIIGTAMISAITLTITTESRTKKVVSVVCGVTMLIALIKPIKQFDYTSFKQNFAQLNSRGQEFADPLEEVNENLIQRIIEEKYAAYILDKGKALGIENLEVSVRAQKVEEWWFPSEIEISTDADESQKRTLAYEIEAGLGVPYRELVWGETND